MKLTFRQIANLVLVGVVSVVAMAWASVGLAGVRFDEPKTMRVQLAQSGGALAGSEVTYLGVPIGKVSTARLTDKAVELRLTIRPKGPMARTMRADVRQKSSLGEPYVDLGPADPHASDTGDPDGAVVPAERTSTPRPLYELLTQADKVLGKIEPEDLGKMAEGLSGLVGHEQDLKVLLSSWADVGEVLARRKAELGGLLSDSARLTAALDAAQADMAGAISGYARVGEVLDRRTADLQRILTEGARLGTEGSDLLAGSAHDIEGTMAGLDTTFHNLAVRPTKMQETIYWMPRFAERIGWTLEGDTMNIGLGGAFPLMPGYQPRFGVPVYGEGLRLDKIYVPSLAQRIDVDFGKYQQQGRTIALVSPEDAEYASQSTAHLLEIIKKMELQIDATPGADLQHLDLGDLAALLVDGDEKAHPDNLRLLLPALRGDLLINDDEEGGQPTSDSLGPGPGDDAAGADGLVGGDPGGEVRPHGFPELGLEPRRAEVEDPGDVGVEPLVVEGGDSDREPTGQPDGLGSRTGFGAVPSPEVELERLEHQQRAEEDNQDDRGPAAPPEAAEHGRSVARAWWAVAAVMAVLAVAGGLAVALRGDDATSGRDEVTQQAERFALALSSYNYRTIDRDLATVRGMGVGNFRYQYEQVLGGDAFRKALSENEAVATAKVVKGPYVASLTDDDARTFTVLEQTLQGKGQAQPQTRRVRVESILVRTTGGWRIDWVEIT